MDARRVLVLLALGACAGAGAACGGSLGSEPMRMSGAGGTTGDTGAGTGGAIRDAGVGSGGSTGATDARVKADRSVNTTWTLSLRRWMAAPNRAPT